MQKYTLLLVSFFIAILSLNSTYASTNSGSTTNTGTTVYILNQIEKNKFYKTIALTKKDIRDTFKEGKKINYKIETLFIIIQINDDLDKLKALNIKMKKLLDELNKKNYFSKKEKKIKMLVENIYSRSEIIIDKYNRR